MVLSRSTGRIVALSSLSALGLSACASTDGAVVAKADPPTPRAVKLTYASLSAAAPVGTPEETAVAKLETQGWKCWGYAVADRSIRETQSGAVLKGSVLTCQVLRGSEVNPFAQKYTAQLLFDKNKLAGIEVALRHNAF